MTPHDTQPIAMAEEYWANSMFSIARYYGIVKFNGKNYIIVNKHGITIFELSNPKSKHYVGDCEKAIPPGEPADLVQEEWIPVYEALGRDEFIKLIEKGVTLEKAQSIIKRL